MIGLELGQCVDAALAPDSIGSSLEVACFRERGLNLSITSGGWMRLPLWGSRFGDMMGGTGPAP